MPDGLTRDEFLGGRVRLWQPVSGYRAGIDPVLLAASVPAQPGETVLELGCGAGAALFCLAARVGDLRATGVEVQAYYAELARRNADENGMAAEIMTADLKALPAELRQRRFDHVMANPPYFEGGTAARDAGRDRALREVVGLADWVDAAVRRAAPKATVSFIIRAERLPELLSHCAPRLGGLRLLPIAPRVGRPARLAVVQGRAGSREPFRLLAPLILHDGESHERDGDDFSEAARAILRDGAALPLDR